MMAAALVLPLSERILTPMMLACLLTPTRPSHALVLGHRGHGFLDGNARGKFDVEELTGFGF